MKVETKVLADFHTYCKGAVVEFEDFVALAYQKQNLVDITPKGKEVLAKVATQQKQFSSAFANVENKTVKANSISTK